MDERIPLRHLFNICSILIHDHQGICLVKNDPSHVLDAWIFANDLSKAFISRWYFIATDQQGLDLWQRDFERVIFFYLIRIDLYYFRKQLKIV